jgi:copper chaperone CopZ
MKTMQFKTNIKCDAYVAKVTPHLNAAEGLENWEVNIKNPEKILTVSTEEFDSKNIEEAVSKAGYQAERLQ